MCCWRGSWLRCVGEHDLRDQRGGEADDRAVEADDEDLGVSVEGLCDVQVEGDEGAQPELPDVGLAIGRLSGYGDVGTTKVKMELIYCQ